MNIIYVAYSCSPMYGSEDAIGWNIPLQASKEGNRVIVITKSEHRESIEQWLQEHQDVSTPEYQYIEINSVLKKVANGPLYSLRLFDFANKALKRIEKICKTEEINVIHQITPVEFRSIGNYGNLGVKYVVGPIAGGQCVPESLFSYLGKARNERLRMSINNFIISKKYYKKRISKVDTIMFANEETKQFFLEHGIDVTESPIMPEVGINKGSCQQVIEKEDSDKVTFVMVGRLISIKGLEVLIDALKLSKATNYEIKVYGDGEKYSYYKNLIINENMEDKVQLMGFVPYTEIQTAYLNSDGLIMPSLREATGTVIVEAMQYGKPVITFNQFGGKYILDSKSGWLIDINQPKEDIIKELAEILDYTAANPQSLKEKGFVAQQRIMGFDWQEKYKYYCTFY